MKRFFLLIVLVIVVSWLIASHRSPLRRPAGPANHWVAAEHRGREAGATRHRRIAVDTRRKTQRALAEAGAEVRQALEEARDEVRQALDEARGEVHQAFDELRVSFASDDERSRALPPMPPISPEANEEAEGLPVPIVPGTRVTEASASPPTPRGAKIKATSAALAHASASTTVTGRLSATSERAVADARRLLRDNVTDWLEPEVPRTWAVPQKMLDEMIVEAPQVESVDKPYGEVFEATLSVDRSPQRRASLIAVYHRQVVARRLVGLGTALAFILICLAAISGYIRADEATKGYYTNRLRMLAAAGVGASGVILYHMIA